MPNSKGPKEQIRRLYSNVIHSVLLYGAPVWAENITRNIQVKRKIYRLQRKICPRMCCGYKTISFVAATILARCTPLDLTANVLNKIYKQVKKNMEREGTFLEHSVKVRLCLEAKREAVKEWKIRVTTSHNTSGIRVTQATVPHLEEWYRMKK
ncbi:uncharacterized protein [Linepithema humile]|uniref:uncharacterized protein n=1 Tax=Linepithema humile TaxID=83485 RepID=UPI00062376E5|nr:PREDICTED: uncharacterized protein LOC105669502 [Linepithema humile]